MTAIWLLGINPSAKAAGNQEPAKQKGVGGPYWWKFLVHSSNDSAETGQYARNDCYTMK